MPIKYLLNMGIVAFLILSIIIFIKSVIFLEGLQTMSGISSFCKTNTGYKQELSCNNLTQSNCNLTSCCFWTKEGKCKSGNVKNGPTFS